MSYLFKFYENQSFNLEKKIKNLKKVFPLDYAKLNYISRGSKLHKLHN